MGIFGFFSSKPEETLAPVQGSQIPSMIIGPSTGQPLAPGADLTPVNSPIPTGITLPTPTASDTPAQPLGGLNVAQPAKKD